jgi:predicted MPP superfamily phosphohydrolase
MPPRRRFTRGRFIVIASLVGLLGQLPGALLLRDVFRWYAPDKYWVIPVVCVLATIPLGIRLYLGITERSETGLVGNLLYLFYIWWGTSITAGIGILFAWPITWYFGLPRAMGSAATLLFGLVAALLGVSWNRMRPRVRQVIMKVPGLPRELDGYRIAQLSDIHMGYQVPPSRVRGWVDRINRMAPDLVAVTGDLIASGDKFLDAVADELGRLRGRDGVALCMGNHDYFGDSERLVAGLERNGIEVLRNRGRIVQRGGARYWLAGVDDTWMKLQDVEKALAGRPTDAPAIVLAHDPKLFDECAARGATLVLSGHTHGGQIAFPLFARTLNPARIAFRYTAGSYRRGDAQLYVSRGAGTTGVPLRIGSPSEIALITLRAI